MEIANLKLNVRGIGPHNVDEALKFRSDRLAQIDLAIKESPTYPENMLEERDLLHYQMLKLHEFKQFGIWAGTIDEDGWLRPSVSE